MRSAIAIHGLPPMTRLPWDHRQALSDAQILQLREIPQMAEVMETWNEVPDSSMTHP